MAACSWGLTCITRVNPTVPLLLEVVSRTMAFLGMCVPVDTLRKPWWSRSAISGSDFTVAVSLLPMLRCDSGEEGGVNVGNRSEVVARATSLSSIAFWWWR